MKKTSSLQSNAGHRYLLYARVSPKGSQWDAQETSINVQLHECRDYVLNRLDPLAQFTEVFDEFRSGKDLNRPGIQQILGDIESGNPFFDTLVVWQLDRLSRNLADAAPLFERLRDAGLGFVSIRQSYLSATGAMARFNLTQTIAIAQLEREMTSERIATKMHWIAQQGKVPWGIIPLGYRRRKDVKNTVETVTEDAELVKQIFATYLRCCERNDFTAMAALWEANRDRIKDSKQFYRILRNRFYVGDIVFKGEIFRGEHQAIISRDVFEEVQEKLPGSKHNAPRPGRQKYAYLLAGLVRCACSSDRYMSPASVNKKGKRYFYYKCTDSRCDSWINAEKLDAAVLDAIRRVVLDPGYVTECYDYHRQQVAEFKKQQAPRIAAALAECDKTNTELQRIDGMFMTGVVQSSNADYWNEKLFEARASANQAKRDYDSLVAAMEPLNNQDKLSAVLESLSGWAKLLESSADDITLKRNLILSTVIHVRGTDRGRFELDLALDSGSGTKKIDITSDEVMSKSSKWWSIRELNP